MKTLCDTMKEKNHSDKLTKFPVWMKDKSFQNYKEKVLDWDKLTKMAPELKLLEFLG